MQLPTGRVVLLESRMEPVARRRRRGATRFSELAELLGSGDVGLFDANAPLDVGDLELCDFHALRAILTRLGWLAEDPVDFACRNCDQNLHVAPCSGLALGPFMDGELHDPELDARLDLTVAHRISPVVIAGQVVTTVTLGRLTAREAMPLHRALRRRRLVLSPRVVAAMGVVALGEERDVRVIAGALERASERAWTDVTEWFLQAHYPPRLMAAFVCEGCGARNDVDAPYEREFDVGWDEQTGEETAADDLSNAEDFPSFDQFDEAAKGIADGLFEAGEESLLFVVEGGVAACDDGGEPLLGSYLPACLGSDRTANPGEITVYFRTVRAIWREEGPYDWRKELEETLCHELAHHRAGERGGDPVDDQEREEIDDEVRRVVGARENLRALPRALGADLVAFVRTTWPIWLVLLVLSLVVMSSMR